MAANDRGGAGKKTSGPSRRLDVTSLLFAVPLRSRLERVLARKGDAPATTEAPVERESQPKPGSSH